MNFHTGFCVCGQQLQNRVNPGLAASEHRLRRKGVHEARGLVAAVTKVDGLKFFAALVEREELKIGGGVVEPRHALGRGAKGAPPPQRRRPVAGDPGASGNDDLESPEVTACVALLAAMIEPEDAEGEDAVDGGCGFCCAYANDGFSSGAAEQVSANVGGTEAVLKVHSGTKAVDFGAKESASEDALKQGLIVAAEGVAGGGGAAIAGGDQFEGLQLCDAHTPRHHAQKLRTLFNFKHGAH